MPPPLPRLPDVAEAHPLCFRRTVALPARDVSSMIAVLDELSGDPALAPGIAGGVRAAAGELRSMLSVGADSGTANFTPGSGNGLLECPKERALDIAALLLDAAACLQRARCHVAAFALEGVEGRLLEALVTRSG